MSLFESVCTDQKDTLLILISIVAKELLEYWLGKTKAVKAGSTLEFIINGVRALFTKGDGMQFGKGSADLVGGHVVLKYEVSEGSFVTLDIPVGVLLLPTIEALEAKLAAGEIDPIKGTDMDKEVLLKGLAEAKKLVA